MGRMKVLPSTRQVNLRVDEKAVAAAEALVVSRTAPTDAHGGRGCSGVWRDMLHAATVMTTLLPRLIAALWEVEDLTPARLAVLHEALDTYADLVLGRPPVLCLDVEPGSVQDAFRKRLVVERRKEVEPLVLAALGIKPMTQEELVLDLRDRMLTARALTPEEETFHEEMSQWVDDPFDPTEALKEEDAAVGERGDG